MIYIDNSGTSYFKPQNSIKALCDYFSTNPSRINPSELVIDARNNIAKFFNFDKPSNLIFTSGDTESLNTVISGLITEKDHVITTYFDHNSVLRPLYRVGCEISFIKGYIEELKKCVKKNTVAVIVNHASNVTGRVQDLHSIGQFCRENNLLFIVDSAQSAGCVPVDVLKDNIDILCFASHKNLLGMQGLGGILVNTDRYIKPLKVGGIGFKCFEKENPSFYPQHLEAGSLNVPGILFLNESIKFINSYGLQNIYTHCLKIRNHFMDYLKTKSNIEIYDVSPFTELLCPVVSFNIKDTDPESVSKYFLENGVFIRSGALCAPKAMEFFNITSCARMSFGMNNTEDDVLKIIDLLEHI